MTIRRIRPLAVTLMMGLPFIAACSAIDADMTRSMKSVGSPFQKELHMQYLELAVAENDEADREDAIYFNNKSMAAAKGENVTPQEIKERKIGAAAMGDITKARGMLTDALGAGWGQSDPKNAAQAQAMFDCWLQEQEEGDQPKDIAACRTRFDAAMATYKPMMKKPMADVPGPITVYFAFDSFDLSPEAMATIKKGAADALGAKVAGVVVAGHADMSGASEYNIGLSRARAAAVRNALIENGLGRDQVKQEFAGEAMPAVKTEDGKREARNRRVVVTFSR